MASENCLKGMRCPKCGSFEPFNICISTTVQMNDDGHEYDGGYSDWDEDSYCSCTECGKHGKVSDFKDLWAVVYIEDPSDNCVSYGPTTEEACHAFIDGVECVTANSRSIVELKRWEECDEEEED